MQRRGGGISFGYINYRFEEILVAHVDDDTEMISDILTERET